MKKIHAIIRPERFTAVKAALEEAGSSGLTVSEVEGYAKQKGLVQYWRGEKYRVALIPKVRLELVVRDEDVSRIIEVILQAARSGEVGDGKIFILAVEDAIRIRTGERGEDAV